MADDAPRAAPAAPAPPPGPWLLRPAVVFSALALLLLVAALLAPRRAGPTDMRLSTHSAAPHGARGLHDLARRLGWRVERLEAPLDTRPDSARVYAVLDPPHDLTPAEAHRVLDAVRRGAGLLVVVSRGSELADSLGIVASRAGGAVVVEPPPRCPPASAGPLGITWWDGRVHSYWLTARGPVPPDTVRFVTVIRGRVRAGSPGADSAAAGDAGDDEGEEADGEEDDGDEREAPAIGGQSVLPPAALGFPLGRGRVVAVADPDLLRNDVIRVCRWDQGVAAAAMLAWLARGRPAEAGPLVFDEYHQRDRAAAAAGPTVLETAWRAPLGRTAAQVAVAALVLLLALGPRPLAPPSRARVQRRSALEHVGALARAYEQVGATRTAARLLVRGVRRRHPLPAAPGAGSGGAAGGDDAAYLAAVAARHPALAADAELARTALERPVAPEELLAVGEAVARIDLTLRQ